MIYLHFTLKTEAIQNLIEKSVQDDESKNILISAFNQMMEASRIQDLQENNYERSNQRINQRKGSCESEWSFSNKYFTFKIP